MSHETGRLIAFDLDGTAIESRPDAMPSSRLVAATGVLQENGFYMAAVTSRPLAYCKDVLSQFSLSNLHVVAGGAGIYDANERKIIEETKLTDDTGAITDFLRNVDYECFVGETDFSEPIHSNELEISDSGVGGIYFLGLQQQKAKDIVYGLRSLQDEGVPVRSVYIDSMMPGQTGADVHILSSEADKGSGVRRLQQLTGFALSQTIAIGDGYNDLPLLQAAKTKVVMVNAEEKLLQAVGDEARQIGLVEDDGLAKYFEELVLDRVL